MCTGVFWGNRSGYVTPLKIEWVTLCHDMTWHLAKICTCGSINMTWIFIMGGHLFRESGLSPWIIFSLLILKSGEMCNKSRNTSNGNQIKRSDAKSNTKTGARWQEHGNRSAEILGALYRKLLHLPAFICSIFSGFCFYGKWFSAFLISHKMILKLFNKQRPRNVNEITISKAVVTFIATEYHRDV